MDTFTSTARSKVMSRIRSTGNWTTEMRLIRIMRKYSILGWRRRSKLPGKPDFVFARDRVAIFVDGDFWHGNPRNFRLPKSNVAYWTEKIARNKARDKKITSQLRRLGWRVLRIWESALADEEAIAARISLLVTQPETSAVREPA